MKTSYLLLVGALAVSALTTARVSASPGGFTGRLTPYQSYAADGITEIHTDPLLRGGPRRWSFGVYAETQRRRLEPSRFSTRSIKWDVNTMMFNVGYDILPQITLLAGAGTGNLNVNEQSYGGNGAWLAAVRMRLLDFYVFDPMKKSDLYWCRIDSVVHYGQSRADTAGTDLEWDELRGALTVSFVNRPNRLGYLDSIGFYIGPAYSKLQVHEKFGGWKTTVQGKNEIGFVAGLFTNPSRHTLLKLELNSFERNSLNLSAGFHF